MGMDNRRALIIEADPRVRRELCFALTKLGWSALAVEDPEEGLAHLQAGEVTWGLVLVGVLASPREEWLLTLRLKAPQSPGVPEPLVMVVSEDQPGEFEVHVDGQLEKPPGNGFSLEAAVQYVEGRAGGRLPAAEGAAAMQ